MRLPNALGALREPNFARYLAATAVSTLGSGIAMVALAFAVLDVGGATDLGIVLLAREIPIFVFLLLGGVFADRLQRRAILVGSDLVKGASQAATAALFFTGTADIWKVALLQTVFGVAVSFSRPASRGNGLDEPVASVSATSCSSSCPRRGAAAAAAHHRPSRA